MGKQWKQWLTLFFVLQNHKEAFLNEQYKEIEENDRMGMTRDLFKKIRGTKGEADSRGPHPG